MSQPEGWRTRAERFVAMPPGFHVTTSPSVLFYHPAATARGEFTVTTDGFMFGGDSPNTYGLFVGGRDLDGDAATWLSFEVGLDGRWVIRQRQPRDLQTGFEIVDLAGPDAGPVALPDDEGPARNALGVTVGADEVAFELNGDTVARLPRADLPLDGVAGFRVGAGLNLHLVTLSITSGGETTNWAPKQDEEAEGNGA
ncbi:MAG: hypothetical protein PVF05_07005 [Gemmatimonadales bacterium]